MQAVAGRPVALECVARGRPAPTLTWYHEGLPVAESNGTWPESGGRVLRLEDAGQANGGLYSCVASSAAGEAVLQYSVEVQGERGPRTLPTTLSLTPAAPGVGDQSRVQHLAWQMGTLRPGCSQQGWDSRVEPAWAR